MRCLVVYSSRTGNTEMIARAIHAVLPEGSVIARVQEQPDWKSYDFICLGYWVDKGAPDADITNYMQTIYGKNVGLFGTLGAYPDSDHANSCREKARGLLEERNTVLGDYLCQGKIDPKLLTAMERMRSKSAAAHPMTDERRARIEEAKKHPDAQDCAAAQKLFRELFEQMHAEAICAS